VLERILIGIALGILEWAAKRPARDADPDRALLERSGAAVRDWVHANRARR
jgi:hypothetical protein